MGSKRPHAASKDGPKHSLAPRLRRVLRLLERIEPERQDTDTLWAGPYFIPRSGEWWPTQFLRYRNELYCTVELGWSPVTLVWVLDSDSMRFEGRPGFEWRCSNDLDLWKLVLEQVERKLRSAIAHPAPYNRRVARLLPERSKTGRIRRRLAWPRGARHPMSRSDMMRLERALERGLRRRAWRGITLRRYLEVAAIAYDAVFPELKQLGPREKYERKADRRHGGLLDLRPADARGFEHWYESRVWAGTHPWEIVFAHPHGILLSPHREAHAWRFYLSVDTLGLYVSAARMTIALGEAGVPLELLRRDEVLAALRGADWVEVGPFYEQLSLDELEERRPGAAARVIWDAPPTLSLRRAGERPAPLGATRPPMG